MVYRRRRIRQIGDGVVFPRQQPVNLACQFSVHGGLVIAAGRESHPFDVIVHWAHPCHSVRT